MAEPPSTSRGLGGIDVTPCPTIGVPFAPAVLSSSRSPPADLERAGGVVVGRHATRLRNLFYSMSLTMANINRLFLLFCIQGIGSVLLFLGFAVLYRSAVDHSSTLALLIYFGIGWNSLCLFIAGILRLRARETDGRTGSNRNQ